jgi:hypothetical protein
MLAASGCGSDSRPVEAPPVQPPRSSSAPPAPMGGGMASPASFTPASSMEILKGDLAASTKEIDGALASLNKLTNPQTSAADLPMAFNDYSDHLSRLNQASEKMKMEADSMRATRAEYFAKWEQKTGEIDNPNIRASAEARKNRLRAGYQRITDASVAAKDAYEPFMRDLQDVRKYLSADLTPQSVSMLGDVSKKANADGAVVKQRINAVIAELDAVERGSGGAQ